MIAAASDKIGWHQPRGWLNPARVSDSGTMGPSAPIWEQALLGLWFWVTFISRPNDELLLYPLALYWVGAFFLRRTVTVPLALKAAVIFTLPALAMASWAWAEAPNAALRFGIMWTLSGMVAIYVAGRFAPHEIIRAVFFAGLVTVVMVAPEMSDFGRRGPWGEKNIFAVRMVVILLTAMAVAYNKYEPTWLRLLAFPLIPTCYIFIIIAQSATSLVFASVSILIMTTVWLFWSRLSRIRHMRTVLAGLLALAALGGMTAFINMPHNTFYEDTLESLGKDTTLTGRTMLWDAAERITREKPLLGVGAESFWQWGHGEANTLLELSHKAPGTKFSFHNSYLEVQVHLGYVGLWLMIAIVAWCVFNSALAWIQTQSVVRSFFLLIVGIVFVSSFTESWLYSVFDTSVTLFYVAAVSAIVRRTALRDEAAFMAEAAHAQAMAEEIDPAIGLAGAE